MSTERAAFEYDVVVKGLFGRNRKAKLGIFKIVRTETKLDPSEVLAKALEICKTEKVKPGAFVTVREQPGTVSDYGDGLTSFSFMCFSDIKLGSGWVSEDGTLKLS
jgi:hypothetical protein